jgi:hypothetical protein
VTRQIKAILGLAIAAGLFGGTVLGQAPRKSVSGAEVTGTFRYQFTGKFKGNYNEIKILALGKGKLRVSFDLTYPFVDGTGQMEANVGQIDGDAGIQADIAMFTGGDSGECRIRLKFVRPGVIKVEQQGDSTGCGFGFNVSADGIYKKTSNTKPKFE